VSTSAPANVAARPGRHRPTPSPAPVRVPPPLPVLGLHAVGKRWAATSVLDGLELALEPGTLTWVGGRNGAGKTTMLRIAAGLIDPDAGSVSAFGLHPRAHHARYQRLVSFLPAGDRGLYARLSVRQQLEFCARINLIDAHELEPKVAAALEDFDLRELAGRRVDRMSMGQRQRLRVAIALLGEPLLVLLDEPLTSLDAQAAQLLCAALVRVRTRGGAVLWCSPSGEQPGLALDGAFTLADGRLEAA
jgi:ABC-type multidrug transport system ATPase subunit